MCMESKDYKKALYYYRISKQHQYIDTVFYEIIWHVAMTGDWFDISTLESEKYDGIYYTIYQHLHHLHNHIEKSELKEAAEEFRALVDSDTVPNHIKAVVIWEGLALIRGMVQCLFLRFPVLTNTPSNRLEHLSAYHCRYFMYQITMAKA